MSRLRNGAAGASLAALAVATIGGFEGYKSRAYRDSIGVPTACYGETYKIRMGMHFTKAECDAMFARRLDQFANGMERCVKRPMGPDTYVAFLSLSYNIGTGGFCSSRVPRLYNAGDERGACRAMLKFDRAGGRVLPGLENRRRFEEKLCLKDL